MLFSNFYRISPSKKMEKVSFFTGRETKINENVGDMLLEVYGQHMILTMYLVVY